MGVLLLAIGCVLLYLPLSWVVFPLSGIPFSAPLLISLPIILLSIILVYAIYNTKKLFERNESEFALLFMLGLIGAIVLSIVAVSVLYPIVAPKFSI